VLFLYSLLAEQVAESNIMPHNQVATLLPYEKGFSVIITFNVTLLPDKQQFTILGTLKLQVYLICDSDIRSLAESDAEKFVIYTSNSQRQNEAAFTQSGATDITQITTPTMCTKLYIYIYI
jgi:hypothetical protein